MRLIDADTLYEQTCEWEATALHMVEKTMRDDDLTEWRRWTAILGERTAFKHDVADAPTIEDRRNGPWYDPERKNGRWYDVGSLSCRCSECGCKSPKEYSFCPNCGAEMEGEQGLTTATIVVDQIPSAQSEQKAFEDDCSGECDYCP